MPVKTTVTKKEEIKRDWHFVDAEGKVLGHLASDIAKVLIGKHKPTYTPNLNVGDMVVVTNAAKIAVTGKNKKKKKVYKHYTGYPGAVKDITLAELMEKKPTEALRKAVKGMLPKNKLQRRRMANLYIYEGSEHPHSAQQK